MFILGQFSNKFEGRVLPFGSFGYPNPSWPFPSHISHIASTLVTAPFVASNTFLIIEVLAFKHLLKQNPKSVTPLNRNIKLSISDNSKHSANVELALFLAVNVPWIDFNEPHPLNKELTL